MSEPLVSIITVDYNQTEMTFDLVESILKQAYQNVETIVVDNAGRENHAALFAARYPGVRFIRSEKNLGFAGGNNLALAVAKGDYLFFVNNDAEITPGCIRRLLDLFEQNPKAGIVSPMIFYGAAGGGQTAPLIQYAGMTPIHPVTARNRTIGALEQERGQYDQPVRTAYAHGAAMMVPRAVLEKAGPMAEDFFLYYEELDWCERIRRAGYEVWVEPRARAYHKESAAVQKLGALKTYYLNRNRIYFMRRNFGGWKLYLFYTFLWGVTVPKNTVLLLLRGQFDNLKAFFQGVLWNFGLKSNRFERMRTQP
jgi:GT2 family glycosyltransferase